MPSIDFTVFKGAEGGKIVKGTTHRDLRDDDVVVKITHSGLCYTDILFCERDIVLGHEGVGLVEQVGPSCTMFKPGDRVGWSYMQGTCGTCDLCFQGEDMYCEKAELYGFTNPDIGSFASHAVIREPFLLRVPDAIEPVHAGPLFCGGVTVFEALTRYGVKSTDRVGVIGIGGVGHLAIQFACMRFTSVDICGSNPDIVSGHDSHDSCGSVWIVVDLRRRSWFFSCTTYIQAREGENTSQSDSFFPFPLISVCLKIPATIYGSGS
ncbi:GroES-like protein [Schizophyllum commune Tattone D]|nr:GroES-like protein [Schizophyllum commune Tattone D]